MMLLKLYSSTSFLHDFARFLIRAFFSLDPYLPFLIRFMARVRVVIRFMASFRVVIRFTVRVIGGVKESFFRPLDLKIWVYRDYNHYNPKRKLFLKKKYFCCYTGLPKIFVLYRCSQRLFFPYWDIFSVCAYFLLLFFAFFQS